MYPVASTPCQSASDARACTNQQTLQKVRLCRRSELLEKSHPAFLAYTRCYQRGSKMHIYTFSTCIKAIFIQEIQRSEAIQEDLSSYLPQEKVNYQQNTAALYHSEPHILHSLQGTQNKIIHFWIRKPHLPKPFLSHNRNTHGQISISKHFLIQPN